MDQKTIEEMYRQMDKLAGERDYWKQLSGTYRNANHRNIKRMKAWRTSSFILSVLFIALLLLLVVIK